MNLKDIIGEARTMADDKVDGELWSDQEWIRWAAEAEREACRRARLLVDSTSDMLQLQLPAGVPLVKLDPRILFIRRARLEGRRFLVRVSHHELDCRSVDWEDERGEPRGYVPDMDTAAFRPYPVPEEDMTVRLTVVRLPMKSLDGLGQVPEIAPHLHMSLVSWMLYRAYSKPDTETLNPKKAADHLAEFEREFGPKSSAIDEAWLQREHEYLPAEGNF